MAFSSIRHLFRATTPALALGLSLVTAGASLAEERPARELFGAMQRAAAGPAQPYGFYAKGCMSGAVAIPTDGPTWQAMRLSRNRRYGQPQMIALLERLSQDAARHDGWPGLLLGDISQPRGGPMLSGHASHQIGLDADIWLTPMPGRTLSAAERETISATSMLKKNAFLTVDDRIWTPAHARILMRAASYPEVQRIFVNPAIKKKLCDSWTGDRTAMGKIRPYYGHDYHFHIRLHCPPGASSCKKQAEVNDGDGCGTSLAWWFTKEPWAQKPADPNKPKPKPRLTTLSDLPDACRVVLAAPDSDGSPARMAFAASAPEVPRAASGEAGYLMLPDEGPFPFANPLR